MSKIDPHASAFPVAGLRGFDRIEAYPESGLTKREYFAGLAMSGMLGIGGPHGHIDGQGDEVDAAALAVKYADALLAELDKEQK